MNRLQDNHSTNFMDANIKQPVVTAYLLHVALVLFGIMAPVAIASNRLRMTHSFLDNFLQWDAQWFSTIGKYGYEFPLRIQKQFVPNGNHVPFQPTYQAAAFFPGLPTLIHFLTPIGTLFLIEVLYVLSLIMMYKLVQRRFPHLATSSIILFAVNPCAIFFTALYTETFTVFAVLCIIMGLNHIHQHKSYMLSLAGIMIATSVHDLGAFALIFTLRFIRMRRYVHGLGFLVAGFIPPAIYELYLMHKFHTAFAVFGAEATWNRIWKWPFVNVINTFLHGPMPLDAVFVLVMSIFIISQIIFCIHKDHHVRPLDNEDSLFSLETALWMAGILLLSLCAYIPGYPLKSVLRFLCILWPAFIPTYWLALPEKNRHLWTAFVMCLFFAFGSWGAAFYTHGWFFQ